MLDNEKKCILISYSWKPEAVKRFSNRSQAPTIQRRVENRLNKAGKLDEYISEMKNQINKLSLAEVNTL